jgi:hypothetical protein
MRVNPFCFVTIQVQTESWQDRIMREWTTNSVLGHGLFFMILSCHDSVIYVNGHFVFQRRGGGQFDRRARAALLKNKKKEGVAALPL